MRKPVIPITFFFLLTIVFANRQPAFADCRFFSGLIENGGYAVADNSGQITASCNAHTPFIPASIVKIPLALAAMEILGSDYQFETKFYVDGENNLYIQGYGDPFLVSEEVALILDKLVLRGIRAINAIFIDNNQFDLSKPAPGSSTSDNPYDAPVNAVVVNFNTVNILVKENGDIVSAEPQTPTLRLMKELGKDLAPGKYRLNVCQKDCDPGKMSARYAAEFFRALQQKRGLPGDGPLTQKGVPKDAKLFYTHKNSKTLEEVVLALLKYSNNIIANQVFLYCGIQQFGGPATWEKGRVAVRESLVRILGIETAGQLFLEEGAGLSRSNRVTASAVLKVLEKFKPYADLLQEKKDVRLKSGTLQGVYNYAGYLHNGNPFVILLNQQQNNRDSLLKKLVKNQP